MKIICSKNDLNKGVRLVLNAVPIRTTMPILECILIDATTDVIKLTANDMELGIETRVEGDIIQRGIIAIKAKRLNDIVRSLPNSEITIEVKGNNKVTITCEKIKFDIEETFSGEDFSYLPIVEKETCLSISEFSLRQVIQQTIFSIADNENNKMMSGELFEIYDNILKVVSLDGHRISIRKIELNNNYPLNKVIVPGKTLQEISKMFSGDADKNVDIYFTKNNIVFEFDNTTVVSRLIEGNYFNIDQMLSYDHETRLKVYKKEFLDSLERSLIFIRESEKRPVIIDLIDDNMNISIKSQAGSMDEEIGTIKEGKDLRIGFNPKFLIDALRAIEDEEVEIYFMNSKAPCIIKDEQQTYIYLILPINQ